MSNIDLADRYAVPVAEQLELGAQHPAVFDLAEWRAETDAKHRNADAETRSRRRDMYLGRATLVMSVAGSGASLVAEGLQDNLQQNTARDAVVGVVRAATESQWYDRLAAMPLDGKAVAVAFGAFALAGTSGKMARYFHAERDRSADYTAYAEKGRLSHRVARFVGESAVAGTATVGAYFAARHGNALTDTYVATGLHAAAIARVSAAEIGRSRFRRRNSGR